MLAHRDLVEQTELPKATVTRLIRTLQAQGYLVLDRQRAGYHLGVPILSLARCLILQCEVLEAVSPVIRRVADRTRAMVGFGTAHGCDIVYLDGVNQDQSRPGRRIGQGLRVPILGSSIGHAWLAGLSAQQRATELARLEQVAAAWHPRAEAAVSDALGQLREHGYCSVIYNNGSHLAIAAPVIIGSIVHAFNVVAPVDPKHSGAVPKTLTDSLAELQASISVTANNA